VLLGNGNGTFKPVVTYDLFNDAGLPMSLAVADVNGDGKPDLVVTNDCHPTSCSTSSVSVLLGKGDGTFQALAIYDSGGFGAMSAVVADVNGDGKPDLVVANDSLFSSYYCGPTCARGQAAVLLGNGDGTFQGAVTYDSDAYSSEAVAVADVNGDGKPDLVATNLCAISKNCNGQGFTNRGAVSVLISAPAATTSLVSSRNPSIFGQSVTFTATVSSSFRGTVTFAGTAGTVGEDVVDWSEEEVAPNKVFFTNCTADFNSSNVTPCVERLVSLTLFAWTFRCVSDSSSRAGGTCDF